MQLDHVKHLVECNCTLKIFDGIEPTIFHKFVVFSVIEADGKFRPSYAACNNCGGVHRVTEVGKSQKLKRETAATLPNVDEIKASLPEKLVGLLEKYTLDLPTWQQIQFLLDNEQWGTAVVITKETDGDLVEGKYLILSGRNLWRVDTFSSENV